MDFIKISKDEQVVTGIVYSSTPDGETPRVDSQGDWCKMSVLKAEMQRLMSESEHICFDVQHSGGTCKLFPVLQHFMCEKDTMYKGRQILKGDYIMSIKITDPIVWEKIRAGTLNGFSISGWAMQ